MCCYSNPRAKNELLQDFGNRKTIRLWKEITHRGLGIISRYVYSPGIHKMKAPFKRYRLDCPQGFHVYTSKPEGSFISYDNVLIRVVCHRDHLVRVGTTQAVFTQILILKADWASAFDIYSSSTP